MIKEDFLHYLWKLKKFDLHQLKTSNGQSVQILDAGIHNLNAGPDFLHARITIGDILWVGSVEMHLLSSDWYRHHHQDDQAYNNVILHVVLEEDTPVNDHSGAVIPCLEMKYRISATDLKRYQLLQYDQYWIPCAGMIKDVPDFVTIQAIEKGLASRMIRKAESFNNMLTLYENDWERVFFIALSRYFGTNVNNEAFEMLAKSIPLPILSREKDKTEMVEALFFGQAGMLDIDFSDAYPKTLKENYRFLQKKYGIQPISVAAWKFLRLRPDNFPTIRIAQLAALMIRNNNLFSEVLPVKKVHQVYSFLLSQTSDYWQTHYLFDRQSPARKKETGRDFINILIINAIVPLKFLYAQKTGNDTLKEEALGLLEQIKAENNLIINEWKQLGIRSKNAFESQGLIELKKNHCSKKKCLDCPAGHFLMRE